MTPRIITAAILACSLPGWALAQTQAAAPSRLDEPALEGAPPADTTEVAERLSSREIGNWLRQVGSKPPKPEGGAAPSRRYTGTDTCRWANDGECDDPGIGTGACQQGTDYSDCWRVPPAKQMPSLLQSCPHAWHDAVGLRWKGASASVSELPASRISGRLDKGGAPRYI